MLILLVAFLLCHFGYSQIFQYFIVNQHDQTAKVIDTIKLPTCTHFDHDQNVTLRGGIKAGKFTKHGIVNNMKDCIDACCRDEKCSVSFMPGNVCYTVNCYSERLCESIPATPSKAARGSVQISHIVRGGGSGDEVDEFRKTFGVHRNTVPGGDKCVFSRASYNTTIASGDRAGEVIDLGPVVDVRDCSQKCCEHSNCEVAHVSDGHCYAIDCYTEDLCQSIPITDPKAPSSTLVYINKRNGVRQRDKDICVAPCVNGLCTKWDACTCDAGFSGLTCNDTEDIGLCDPDCGDHGICLFNDTCSCDQGWEGYKCHKQIICKDSCDHGFCLDSGSNTCKCDIGWSGRLCNESNSDKLVMASSGEEVLFTESEVEPEYNIKIHSSPYLGKSEAVSAVTVAVACGVGAAVLGTSALVFLVKQLVVRKTVSNYELVNRFPVAPSRAPLRHLP